MRMSTTVERRLLILCKRSSTKKCSSLYNNKEHTLLDAPPTAGAFFLAHSLINSRNNTRGHLWYHIGPRLNLGEIKWQDQYKF